MCDNRISRLACLLGFLEEIDLIKSNLSLSDATGRQYIAGVAHDDRAGCRIVAAGLLVASLIGVWQSEGGASAASVFATKITSI